jgi:hypothetical protein
MQSTYLLRRGQGYTKRIITDSENPFKLVEKTEIDYEPILDEVKFLSENQRPTRGDQNHWRYCAKVPMDVYERSIHENWDDDDWKKWLNDPQNEPFRVWKGKV